MIRYLGFAPETTQEWFALLFGVVVGSLVGYAIVAALVAAARGN